jgi:hypothetical protein
MFTTVRQKRTSLAQNTKSKTRGQQNRVHKTSSRLKHHQLHRVDNVADNNHKHVSTFETLLGMTHKPNTEEDHTAPKHVNRFASL